MTHRVGLLAASVAALLLCVFAWAAMAENPSSPAATAGQLAVVKTLVAGGEGRWDYVTIDSDARRAYVARTNRVMVMDADNGKLLGEVADINGAHGIAIPPGGNEGFATNGKDDSVSVFDLKTFKTIRKIKAGKKPDAICYDPFSKKVFAINGNGGTATIIDPAASDKTPATLDIGGKLEFAVSDGCGRVFVNVEDKNEVVAIDSKQMKVLAHWPTAPGEGPSGLAIDTAHKRLFSVCSNKKMIVLDAESGKVLADLPIGPGVDGAVFDPQSGLAMSANGGDGTLTAVKADAAGKFAVVQTLATAKGAKTIGFDEKTHRAYLPCNVPVEGGKPSFGLLVVGAGK